MSDSILKCLVVKTTAQAVHVLLDDLKTVWIPRSVIRDGEGVKVKDKNIYVEDWFTEKEQI